MLRAIFFSVFDTLLSMLVRKLLMADQVFIAICIENIFSVSDRFAFASMLRMSLSTFAIWVCSWVCNQIRSKPSRLFRFAGVNETPAGCTLGILPGVFRPR